MAVERNVIKEDVATWVLRDFSAGLMDSVSDNLLPDNAAKDCRNVISRTIGVLEKRTGQARLNSLELGGPIQGMHAYYYGSNRRLVVASNGAVYYWNPSTLSFNSLKTGLDIYAQVNFETLVNYMVAFNGVNPPWKWDGTTVSVLANAPADGQFCTLFADKLFTVPKSDPSCLKWSESFQPENWPASNYWYVKKGDGDYITCLRRSIGQLIIFKRRSMHVLQGVSLDDFKLTELDSRRGCVGAFAAVSADPYVYFISEDGPCVWNGMRVINLVEDHIDKLWKTVNREYLYKASVGIWNGLVWFAVPTGASMYNNLVLVYDLPPEGAVGGKWWPMQGINASCFLEYDNGVQRLFYSGDSMSGYVNQQDVGTDDFGNPIDAYWVSKSFDVGAGRYRKKFLHVYVDDVSSNKVGVNASLDYGTYIDLVQEESNSLERRLRFPAGSYGQYMSLKLSHNALGSFQIRGLAVDFTVRPRAR